jgi:hypothetical protein
VAAGYLDVFFAPRERGKSTMPTATTYTYHFKKALKDASITKPGGSPKYTLHGLRHFFASTALAHGIPIHEASRWLGHRSIKTTVDVYGHLVPASWERCWAVRTLRVLTAQPYDPAVHEAVDGTGDPWIPAPNAATERAN